MKTLSAILLLSLVTISYQSFSQSDSLKRRELLNAYCDSVIHACTTAIKINPKAAEAYCKRGIAYYTGDNYDNYGKALADLSKAIELRPNYADAYYYRAKIYLYLLQIDLDKVREYSNKSDSH
jgi:Tfp pilus assembly protein PilF